MDPLLPQLIQPEGNDQVPTRGGAWVGTRRAAAHPKAASGRITKSTAKGNEINEKGTAGRNHCDMEKGSENGRDQGRNKPVSPD